MTPHRQGPHRSPRAVNWTILTGIGLALIAPLLAVIIVIAMVISRHTTHLPAPGATATPSPAVLAVASAHPASPTVIGDTGSRPTSPPVETPARAPAPEPLPATATATTARVEPTSTLALSALTATPTATNTPAETGTLTATPGPTFITETATAAASLTATATASATASAIVSATPTGTPPPTPAPLAFVGTRAFFDSYVDSFRVVGEVVNNTTIPQQLVTITGVFYDAQGQVLADGNAVLEFFPQAVIPPGDRAPFELLVDDVTAIARYELMVDYVASLLPVRQDLIISNLAQTSQDGRYCLTGVLRNPGARMTEALVIVAVLYDTAGQVVNFSDYVLESPLAVYGAQTLNFEVCVTPPNEGPAQAQVRAWGR